MKNSLLILAGAAALSLASCSQEKTAEVTTAPGAAAEGTTTTTTTTTTAPMSDADVQARAQRIADKMVADMKITDEATKTKIRTVYVNRYKRMNEMKTKYATDTTGMAAAMRDASMAENQEFKVVFVDPTQYQAYESSRSTYDDSNYGADASMSSENTGSGTDAMSSEAGATTTGDNMSTTPDAGMDATKMKVKAEDGSKMKMKENGKVKTKDADGTKMKN